MQSQTHPATYSYALAHAVMFTLYKAYDPFEVDSYIVTGITPRKVIIATKRKKPLEVKEKKRTQGTDLYSCPKDPEGV